MINLAVINIKDIIKFIRNLIITIILIVLIIRFFNLFKNMKSKALPKLNNTINLDYKTILEDTFIIAKSFDNSDINIIEKGSMKEILVSELAIFGSEEKLMELENQEEALEFQNLEMKNEAIIEETIAENQITEDNINKNSENLSQDIPNFLNTKIISTNNKNDVFTDVYHSVKIKNESTYKLTEEMIMPNVDFSNKRNIIIYHTHTCESYTPSSNNNYEATGNFRTTDVNHSIVKVGNELDNNLKKYGFNVIHNATYHDYPAYSGSYSRSLETINNILSKNPNSEFVIDLHRDALGNNSEYGPKIQIGDEIVSQVMFVMGTDGGGLEHPNWINNFKLAVKIQEKANEMYPGFFKPIILRNSRYNQHVTKGACIIEVGATGNTLEQCEGSMKYLAKVIAEVMKE